MTGQTSPFHRPDFALQYPKISTHLDMFYNNFNGHYCCDRWLRHCPSCIHRVANQRRVTQSFYSRGALYNSGSSVPVVGQDRSTRRRIAVAQRSP